MLPRPGRSAALALLIGDCPHPTATLRTNAGAIGVTFSAAPATLVATASVGSNTIRLPRGVRYAVSASATVGSTHVTVPRASSSAHMVTARTRAGSVTVRPT